MIWLQSFINQWKYVELFTPRGPEYVSILSVVWRGKRTNVINMKLILSFRNSGKSIMSQKLRLSPLSDWNNYWWPRLIYQISGCDVNSYITLWLGLMFTEQQDCSLRHLEIFHNKMIPTLLSLISPGPCREGFSNRIVRSGVMTRRVTV